MSYGTNIRRIRTEQGLTQDELARKVGCTQGFIGHIERGIKQGSISILQSIASALGVTVDELLKDAPARS